MFFPTVGNRKIKMTGKIVYRGIEWKIYQNTLVPDLAPHEECLISPKECGKLLSSSRALLMRWTTHFDCPNQTDFWFVIKDNSPSLEELSTNTRSKVRRGLKRCRVGPSNAETIARQGYEVYQKAFAEYSTNAKPVGRELFHSTLTDLSDDPSWEFWEVRNAKGDLIAYSQNRIQNFSCNYSTIKFDPQQMRLYPSYALFHEMNKYYLLERGCRYVNDGARSISHSTNIQQFLIEKFKFRKAFAHLHVHYGDMIGPLIRITYPFRSVFLNLPGTMSQKWGVLLRQEEIRRSFPAIPVPDGDNSQGRISL